MQCKDKAGKKKDLYDSIEEGKLTLVSPSKWLKERAEESSLTRGFKIVHIPNGIDTDIYRPHNTDTLRNIFQIPQKIIGYFNYPKRGKSII